ncbi:MULTISPECIES: DNA starvation/stationary phase protection protein [Neobacillus]|jgi:starvation-inducible DNA-binding protein|uniref:DNA starvation/stationary phase protection protein n=1 Tax=Neobacillus sedimentimangrovi TaxID=2699460 RepID=A0ABS8QKH5_9BACI|nr:DNA starvation/stationary phase protection protein [Neobacillus sedimentimangrovi]AIM15943.1 general stress protein [Bacillus sp. X1(2014)]MCD4839540.1 DNA starvation/stationary phase protection protein [Neobacillus sedimentimangrovi]
MTLEQVLNQQIANWNVLYTKLHRYHWYVKGPHFFTLHAKFEELYEEAAAVIDELAEQLLVIGGSPISTLKEYIQYATIKESTEMLTAEEMVQAVVNDFSQIVAELQAGMEVAEQNNDEVTSDMFLELIEKLNKHNWMLKSFLNA